MESKNQLSHANDMNTDYSGLMPQNVIKLVEPSKQAVETSSELVQTKSTPMDMDSDSEYDDDDEMNDVTKEGIICHSASGVPNMEATNAGTTEPPSNSNIKLVLKKSQSVETSSHPLIQTKSPTNKIFVVTWVTNATTRPVLTNASYSTVQPIDTKVLDTRSSPISSVIDENCENITNESLTKLAVAQQEENDLSRQPLQENKSHESTAGSDIGSIKSAESGSREENDDIESIQSESSEVKPSTPKIARELVQLQKTVNESKILSEYMSESASSKGRKSRKIPLKTGSDTEYTPLVPGRRSRSRSCSKPRIESPVDGSYMSKWLSEEKLNKRQNMRSQNTEFVQKHMKFLNRIHGDGEVSEASDGEQSLNESKVSVAESQIQIIRRSWQPPPKPGWDSFCWKCHTCVDLIACSKCTRSYHMKCLKKHAPSSPDNTWICPECILVDNSLRGLNRTWKGTPLAVDHLNQLLQFALKRMRQLKGHEFFCGAVNEEENPDYYKYVINPVTLESLQKKVDTKAFKCAEEFAVEAKWIHHNAMVYFGNSGKMPNVAKSLVKICRQEVTEIETCPECYYNANTSKDWFVEVCSKPHILLWAKLKGFPYWPAKAMGVNSAALVNVRFFGDYDRAYVPVKECFLYSEKDPNPPTKQNKRNNMASCIKEVHIHIKKIIAKFGSFKFAPFKTPYDPTKELAQLEMMIPGVAESIKKAQASPKPPLTYKIVKTADNHLSIIKKPDLIGTETSTKDSRLSDDNKDTIKIVERKSSVSSDVGSFCKSNSVSPIKVGSLKTYEVVSKKDESDLSKVGSVILKRKSDNWNMISPTSSTKKHKGSESDSIRGEQVISSSSDCGNVKGSPEKTVLNSVEDVVIYKRKKSQEGITSPKAQRIKIDETKRIPLMVLTASTSQVSSSSASTVSSFNSEDESVSNFENNSKSNKEGETENRNEKNDENTSQNPVLDMQSNSTEKESSVDSGHRPEQIDLSPPDGVPPNKMCELIPLTEIKTEKPDSDEETHKSSESIEVRSKTATPERQASQAAISTSSDQQTAPNETEKVVVKTEIPSDNEEDTIQSSKMAETSSERVEAREPSHAADQPAQRISVKDFSTMCAQTAGKKTDTSDKKKGTGVMKVEVKKQNQRARKSFPNKSSFTLPPTTIPNSLNVYPSKKVTSITYQNTSKNMVYIPLDSKGHTSVQKTIPIPPLTAVSKVSVVQSANEGTQANIGTLSAPATSHVSAIATTMVAGNQNDITNPVLSVNVPSSITIKPVMTTSSLTVVTPSAIQTITTPSVDQGNIPQSGSSCNDDHMLSGFVTPGLAAAITDTIVRGPPKLSPKPSRALGAEGDTVSPSKAGPVCSFLMENSHKITDFFRSVIEDTLSDMASSGIVEAKVKVMELDMEKMKYSYEKQLEELKHNTDLMLCEMRNSWEKERAAIIAETRKQCEIERIRAVEECKKKQWCANCGKEAQFYCCWNTSYCDYPCQQKHWARHMSSCAQNDNPDANAQKIGVKITPLTVKDKKAKNTEASTPRLPGPNFIRATLPLPRNPVPLQRLVSVPVPLTNNVTQPRYTILHREGNWELMPSSSFPRVIPTGSVIMADGNGKVVNSTPQTIIRTNQM